MAKSKEEIRFKIVNGPSRWDTVLEGLSKGSQFVFSVSFDIIDRSSKGLISGYIRDLKFKILELHRQSFEKGYSDKWFIFGVCKDDLRNMQIGFDLLERDLKKKKTDVNLFEARRCLFEGDPIFFVGNYFTHSRRGKIKFILPGLFSINNLDTFLPDYLLNVFKS